MARKLRIAVSGFFGLLAIALCVLWVRSYWLNETLGMYGEAGVIYDATSSGGFIYLRRLTNNPDDWEPPFCLSLEISEMPKGLGEPSPWKPWDLISWDADGNAWLEAPHLLWTLATVILGIIPWLPCRFSLRTLLIATTLVAVVLGMGVWLAS